VKSKIFLLVLVFFVPLVCLAGEMRGYYEQLRGEPLDASMVMVEEASGRYARITGAFEGWVELARFQDGSREMLLELQVACGPQCDYELSAYEIKGQVLSDVSRKVLPIRRFNRLKASLKEGESLAFDFKEDPKTIQISKEGTSGPGGEPERKPFGSLVWKSGKYQLREKN